MTGFSKLNWRGRVAWTITYFQQSQAALAVGVALMNMASNFVILFKLPTIIAIGINLAALPFLILFGWIWAHHGPVKAQSEVPFLDGLDTRTKVGMAISIVTLERLGVDVRAIDLDAEINKLRPLMTSTKDKQVSVLLPQAFPYYEMRRHSYDA